MASDFGCHFAELHADMDVLYRDTARGIPVTEAVGEVCPRFGEPWPSADFRKQRRMVRRRISLRVRCQSFGQFPHHLDQVGFAFKADARQLGHDDVTLLDLDAVREAAVGLEQIRVAFVAAKTQSCRDVQ